MSLLKNTQLIAEVKTHSPFGWRSDYSWDYLFDIANSFGDIISIHTDPRWHGSFDLIKRARQLTSKPILAKGIHSSDNDITRAVDAGADLVLVVGRIPKIYIDKCLIEPTSLKELENIPTSLKAVWNSRDLNTGTVKTESFPQARTVFNGWLCQASNITDRSDVDGNADAIIVGSQLPEFIKSLV